MAGLGPYGRWFERRKFASLNVEGELQHLVGTKIG
jgi:hypothetical protein